MNKFRIQMLSYVVAFCLLAGVIFFVHNTKLMDNKSNNNSINLIELEEWQNLIANTPQLKNEKALIIYDDKNQDSINVYKNIEYVLNTIGEEVFTKTIDEQEKYSNLGDYNNIIICLNNLDDLLYNNIEMEDWVRNGKGIFFTMPLDNNSKLLKFANLLGIKNQDNISTINYEHMIILDDFLINGKDEVFDNRIISGTGLKLELIDNVRLHIATDDEYNYPIVWNLKFGNGFVSVCNADFLYHKDYRGIIISSYAELQDYFVYPVINASMYSIDDFPAPIPVGYDSRIYQDYNCSLGDFYFNIWWPQIKELHKKYGIIFSGYLIQTYENIVKPPFNNLSYYESAKYYANSLLEINGELGIHGYNHQPLFLVNDEIKSGNSYYLPWNNMNDIVDSIRSVISYGNTLAPNNKVTSYVAPSNLINPNVLSILEKEIKEFKVYAGVYRDDESEGSMIQEFEVKENGIITVPRTSAGMDSIEVEHYRFLLLSELSYQYIQSHFFHPDDVLDNERGAEKGFDYLYNQLESQIKFLSNLPLRKRSVTEGAAAIQRYELTSYKRYDEYDKINLEIEGIKDEVYYILRINNYTPIKNIKGGTIQKISDTYYLLKASQRNVTIELETET